MPLSFPRDHGAHPDFRIEWWYVTGWLRTAAGRDLGFQVTFFRSRTGVGTDNPSRFAPRQVILAHVALADSATGRFLHDQRVARAGFGFAQAATGDTDVGVTGWTLRRAAADGSYSARVTAADFGLELTFRSTTPPLLQGSAGYSRKGPRPEQASYYYSLPQLRVTGSLAQDAQRQAVTGSAWLDHEWSSSVLDPNAVGWDWTGLNLADGGALMAFSIRGRDGSVVWSAATLRRPDGGTERSPTGASGAVAFTPMRSWRSPRTGASYPVEQTLTVGPRRWRLVPLFDHQELDSRAAGGVVYWEGAVRALDEQGREAGRGYLELTGYFRALRL